MESFSVALAAFLGGIGGGIAFPIIPLLGATLVLQVVDRHLSLGGLGAEPTSGVLLATLLGTGACGTVVAGRLSDRSRSRAVVALPPLMAMIAGFALLGAVRSPIRLAVVLALLGAGMGGLSGPLLAMVGDLGRPASAAGRWASTICAVTSAAASRRPGRDRRLRLSLPGPGGVPLCRAAAPRLPGPRREESVRLSDTRERPAPRLHSIRLISLRRRRMMRFSRREM